MARACANWIRGDHPKRRFWYGIPGARSKITSGVQLFGSSTFWLFWKDGYSAMAALDDNADAWLSGKELKGLSLWQDRNRNGVSEPGEVTPIDATEIAALAVNSTGTDGGFISNSQGLRLKSGALLPTWDWVATAGPRGGRAGRLSPPAAALPARE
ncbi:MAG: hypothetical protein QM758_27195 [Armatimonas sp.]